MLEVNLELAQGLRDATDGPAKLKNKISHINRQGRLEEHGN